MNLPTHFFQIIDIFKKNGMFDRGNIEGSWYADYREKFRRINLFRFAKLLIFSRKMVCLIERILREVGMLIIERIFRDLLF